MFKKIAIIGVGLIGGSLARALKAADSAIHISGCAASEETVKILNELGIVDFATTKPEEAVKGADCVVLCIPLGTYSDIVQKISAHMERACVLTDAGSVKGAVVESVLPFLSDEQKARFVPGHPIAGTEKSGPRAAMADLFKGRKTILTPLSITDNEALQKTVEMWEAAGANIELLDAKKHDVIYANVSHNIQFLSSAFGLMLGGLPQNIYKEIAANIDENFRKFIRLIGSDPVMWRDIFVINRQNLVKSIEDFKLRLRSLLVEIEGEEKQKLLARITAVKEHRLAFHAVERGNVPKFFQPSEYASSDADVIACMDMVPVVVGCALVEGVPESEYEHASGAGFHTLTRNVILDDARVNMEKLCFNKEVLLKITGKYLENIDILLGLIKESKRKELESALKKARDTGAGITRA